MSALLAAACTKTTALTYVADKLIIHTPLRVRCFSVKVNGRQDDRYNANEDVSPYGGWARGRALVQPTKFQKGHIIMNRGKNVGDKVIWMQVKSYGDQKELSKREGVIVSINGSKATVALTGYGAGNVTVPLADLTPASQDTRMSILEFAMRKFGANAQQ